ncbi:uncharacterized protein RJT21DRAFT_4280 [Scheffersomyces amazonensis]|uniref:uncharacterized protein n=1 Tax=Scheffersomyces amazonensis TaxID=1078765 RepID=UPI00315D352E
MVQQGSWWTAWELASGWGYCNLDPNPGAAYSFSEQWTIGYSIAVDMGIEIEEIITLGLGLGVSLEKSISKSTSISCPCSGPDPVCVWEQSKMNWSDSQVQTCTRFSNCDGGYVTCGAWSAYQRTNAPYKSDSKSFNFGCSAGVHDCTANN